MVLHWPWSGMLIANLCKNCTGSYLKMVEISFKFNCLDRNLCKICIGTHLNLIEVATSK
jgi:hypothetical protein